jgi:hypothetical protein
MGLTKNYNLKVLSENIDRVLLKLSLCSNVEIRNVLRRAGMIQIKAVNLDSVSDISEIQTVEKDKNFYINRIAII